jgi:type IV pilus assembly protein PilM
MIGLDLGATAVRAAMLTPVRSPRPSGRRDGRGGDPTQHGIPITRPGGTGPAARRWASVPLPTGAIRQGVVHDRIAVTRAVRRLVATNGLRNARVVLGIGTPQVVVRALTLPPMPADALRQALPYQARDVLPFRVTDAVLDFCPIPGDHPVGATERSPVEGLLTAAPRAAVLAAMRAVQDAGLTVARVDLSPFGVLRAIGSGGAAVEALVDIGSELTTIVVHRHGTPHLVRVVPFGGRQVTDRLADGLGVSAADAEATKRTVGAVGDSMPALQVRDGLLPVLSEVRASLRYFVTTVGSAVDRVLLTGGTSALPGLVGLLGAELALPVRIGMPLRHLDSAPDGEGERWAEGEAPFEGPSAVSVGLALGPAA